MMRNELFELIRASQIEDYVVIKHTYNRCDKCNSVEDVYIKACSTDLYETVYICKDCFCNSHDWKYCIPFSLLGQYGYIGDDTNISYLYSKHETINQGGICGTCGVRDNYGVFAYVKDSKQWTKPKEYMFICKECFTSQKWVSEELNINSFKKIGIKLFNESKDNSK